MPGHSRKSAAVPYLNHKGERSMKRVKVERYVAGKQPSYAKKEEDDDEHYITDEEYTDEEEENFSNYSTDNESEKASRHPDEDDVSICEKEDADGQDTYMANLVHYDQDEDDNPLVRALRHNALTRIMNALDLQLSARAVTRPNEQVVFEDEDDEVRERHRLVKDIVVEEKSDWLALRGDDSYDDANLLKIWQHSSDNRRSQREETEDILKDLNLEGFRPKFEEKDQESQMENSIKDMIEQAKEEAIFKSQLYKKIEEDNKIEKAMEAFKKDELGSYDMETVNTDDEDDDIAYHEWKLREMKRILRDRTARLLENKNKLCQPNR